MTPQVVFTVNGPGEVSAWLWPVSHALRRAAPHIRQHALILPCVFSAGTEAAVAERLGTLDSVTGVAGSMAFVRRGRRPAGLVPGPTVILHLGGEAALTRILGWRLGAPLWAYAEAPFAGIGAFARVYFSGLNPLPARWADPGRRIGDLMVDAAALRRALAPPAAAKAGPVLGLFPGSRDYAVRPLLPYYAWFVNRLAETVPGLTVAAAKADFIPESVFETLPPPPAGAPWPSAGVRLVRTGGARWLETDAGHRIDLVPGREVTARADAALTIPGTNTGEIAAAGIPMAVIAPLYLSEQVPLPGLAGHIGRIPRLGPAIKRAVLRRQLARMPFLALPNRRAGRMIVPEFVGTGLHDRVLATLATLLTGDTAAIRADLVAAMGPAGAAEHLARALAEALAPAALPAGQAQAGA